MYSVCVHVCVPVCTQLLCVHVHIQIVLVMYFTYCLSTGISVLAIVGRVVELGSGIHEATGFLRLLVCQAGIGSMCLLLHLQTGCS